MHNPNVTNVVAVIITSIEPRMKKNVKEDDENEDDEEVTKIGHDSTATNTTKRSGLLGQPEAVHFIRLAYLAVPLRIAHNTLITTHISRKSFQQVSLFAIMANRKLLFVLFLLELIAFSFTDSTSKFNRIKSEYSQFQQEHKHDNGAIFQSLIEFAVDQLEQCSAFSDEMTFEQRRTQVIKALQSISLLPQEAQLESRESQGQQLQLYNRQDCDRLREAFEKQFADEYSRQIAYDNIYEAFVKNLKESGEAKSRNFDLDLFDSKKNSLYAVGGLSLASTIAFVTTVLVVTSVLISMLAIVMFKQYQRVIGANQNGHV